MNFLTRQNVFAAYRLATTFIMVAFHIGALAALFMFSWKTFLLAIILWWIAAEEKAVVAAVRDALPSTYSAIVTLHSNPRKE